MALKWKRPEAGHYRSTNDRWMILKEGSKWKLYDTQKAGDQEVFSGSNKADCKEEAEKKNKKAPPSRKPPPRRPGKTVQEPETLAEVIETGEASVPVDCALRSLYLEVSALTLAVERVAKALGDVVGHPKVKKYLG